MTTSAEARETTGLMQRYAKTFSAGAFAMPIASEFDKAPSSFRTYDGGRIVTHTKQLTRDSVRKDWTGRPFRVPAGAIFASHVARSLDSMTRAVPSSLLSDHDYLQTYVEDAELTEALLGGGRSIVARRVTSASELITVWGPRGLTDYEPLPFDAPTVKAVPMPEHFGRFVEPILTELEGLEGWADDYPYYSDGTWGAVSLRGFYPDPARGVKPAEMNKGWKAEHPNDLRNEIQWTELAGRMPRTVELIQSFSWWPRLERVRLLRMAGNGGKGGSLGRHTDITDKASGPLDGQITRFHIPLVSDPEIKLHHWELDGAHHSTHLPEWGCFYLDARKPHAVVNPTGVNRVHLVADVVSDSSVRAVLSS